MGSPGWTCWPAGWLCVDAGGTIWTALWDGAAVAGLRDDGDRVATIAVGTPRPTSCAIAPGGDRMAISTATFGLDDPGAHGGELWTTTVPGRGQPQHCWPA